MIRLLTFLFYVVCKDKIQVWDGYSIRQLERIDTIDPTSIIERRYNSFSLSVVLWAIHLPKPGINYTFKKFGSNTKPTSRQRRKLVGQDKPLLKLFQKDRSNFIATVALYFPKQPLCSIMLFERLTCLLKLL